VNRINEIREFKRLVGDKYFIVGWVEGPVAAYADIRGLTEASMDFLDDPDACGKAMDVIVESAIKFITLQIEAGAHCIGIGDAFCSQIGPGPYRELAFEREKRLVNHIHSIGAKAKLHVCGNTSPIMKDMIATGADILDVDHLVPDMGQFAGFLSPAQAFSGKSDPVSIIQNGTPEQITESVCKSRAEAGGRVIVSAGCEVPPGHIARQHEGFPCGGRVAPDAAWVPGLPKLHSYGGRAATGMEAIQPVGCESAP
jgi:uroporphyrinogen decarboxylase